MHCGAEVTESSTNKQHHLSHPILEFDWPRFFLFFLARKERTLRIRNFSEGVRKGQILRWGWKVFFKTAHDIT